MTAVIIPCRNEQSTIRDVVKTFVNHHSVTMVLVVIDPMTTDLSEKIVLSYRSTLSYGQKKKLCVINSVYPGKGQCIKEGLRFVKTTRVIFCDSDIFGLTQNHVDLLIKGKDLTIGVPDYPRYNPYPYIFPALKESWPWVSGERSLPTRIAKTIDLHGYLMEVQINQACQNAGQTAYLVPLTGLLSPFIVNRQRIREMERDRKWGITKGVLKH